MKKNLAKKVTLSILAGAVLMSSGVVWARDIEDKVTLSGGDPWKQTTIIINGYMHQKMKSMILFLLVEIT